MNGTELNFEELAGEVEIICEDLITLATTAGPTRCVAKLNTDFDPRIGGKRDFPFFENVKKIVDRWNNKESKNLILTQDYGNIILISGFEDTPPIEEIKNIPFTLASHADEISFIKKKSSLQILPLFNAEPLKQYGIAHRDVEVFGFRGLENEREFIKVGSGKLSLREKEFYLEELKGETKEGDLIIQNYDLTPDDYNLDTIFHVKALDDRAGVLAHLYTMKELDKYNIKAKAIFVGDEEGINSDIAWARLARPVFKKYCREDGIIVICDGFDGQKLYEFENRYLFSIETKFEAELNKGIISEELKEEFNKSGFSLPDNATVKKEEKRWEITDEKKFIIRKDEGKLNIYENRKGKHLHEALIAPYRSEGKGAGDPGIFSILRDQIIKLANEHGFEAVTTTDYVSRSLDPKIMDDFPSICSIDWSNGPVLAPVKDKGFFPVCHVDESVPVRQLINIIGTTFFTIYFLDSKMSKT